MLFPTRTTKNFVKLITLIGMAAAFGAGSISAQPMSGTASPSDPYGASERLVKQATVQTRGGLTVEYVFPTDPLSSNERSEFTPPPVWIPSGQTTAETLK